MLVISGDVLQHGLAMCMILENPVIYICFSLFAKESHSFESTLIEQTIVDWISQVPPK